MYRKCTMEISVQHQRQVEEALLELMQKLPFEEITVTQLCQSAIVTRRVFYHLFSNKMGALYALIDHRILDMAGYRQELGDVLRVFYYWQEQKALLDALQKNNLTGLLLERMILVAMSEDYEVRSWLKKNGWNGEAEPMVYHLTGMMGLVYQWYYSGFQKTPEEMARLMEQILTQPMGNRP